ncbi:MAG: enoyl-CoA hydratase [Acidimicrobiaceae bacterium]|jgi:enoyl-CoA hydratase/carnithine racemase|nr:enoyl-CoA hydratase [Acidimicrobiaceae bacterium]|tara:strand:- start:51618 stop:52676 length:1059 start_codon:yes stop_codon:yes gene_type:complete
MSVLTFTEACDFIADPFLNQTIYEDNIKVVFVEIDPSAHIDNIDYFLRFVKDSHSVNLIIVGILNCGNEDLSEDFLASFDILLTDSQTSHMPVFVNDLSETILELEVKINSNPQASLVLTQLLRQKSYKSVSSGLLLESFAYGMLQNGSEFKDWLEQRGDIHQSIDSEPDVLAERFDRRLDICLNRPNRSNAFSSSMRDHLFEILQVASIDETITKVELHGSGNSFCSGGDLAEFGLVPYSPDGHLTRMYRHPGLSVHVIAEKMEVYLHGVCAGAGIEIPAFAARVLADESVEIFLPEVSMGLIPGAGGTVSLPRRIGPQKTAFLGISGRKITFSEALTWGLIDEVASYKNQ